MSYYLSLHSWAGSNPSEDGAKIAKVFRIPADDGVRIILDLQAGQAWTFDHTIPNEQVDLTLKYLNRLGFEVNLEPAIPKELPSEAEKPSAEIESVEPIQESGSVANENTDEAAEGRFHFSGNGSGLFKIFIKNLLFTIATLGIYKFWATTNVRKYVWDHVSYKGDAFQYHGTGKELFRGYLRLIGLFLLVGLAVGAMTVMEVADEVTIDLISSILNFIILLLIPLFMVGFKRYLLSRSSWRNVRFSFKGKRMEATGLYIKGWLFSIVTLGFYWPFFLIQKEKFWRENTCFGDKKIEFDGKAKEIIKHYMLFGLLFIPTLSLNYFWYHAKIESYLWSHTRFEGSTFRFTATGREWLILDFVNLFLLIFSFGLAFPWVTARMLKFKMDHLYLEGDTDFDKVVQNFQDSGALGDVALDAMDVDMGIG